MMKTSKYAVMAERLSVALIFILISYTQSLAQKGLPALKPAVEIQDMQITGLPVPGNTVEVSVRYKTNVNASGVISLTTPPHMHMTNHAMQHPTVTMNRSFTKGMTRTEQFQVTVDKTGQGYLHVGIVVPDAPPGYKKTAARSLRIQSYTDTAIVFDPRNPGNRKPKVIGKDVHIYRGQAPPVQNKSGNMQIQSTQIYNVSITGKIRFLDNTVYPEVYRGVYDNGVALWFRNSNNPNDWYNPDTGHARHESYDILDNQGNFSFNFSFTGDLSAYNQVIVIVNTANDAAFVPTPADGYIVYNADGTTTSYFNEGDGIAANFDPSNTNISINQNGEFDPGYGAILRYAMLSKEFVEQRYGGSLPFSLPAIYTRIYALSSQGDAGVFCSSNSCTNLPKQPYGPYIMIDPNWTDFDTISHENGHDVNFRIWVNRSLMLQTTI